MKINLEHIFTMKINFNILLRKPLFIGSIILSTTAFIYLMWSFNSNITQENAALESWQNIFLMLACVLYGYKYKNSLDNMTRYARCGLMLFCFAILLREFDIHRIGTSSIWKTIETLIRGTTLIAFVVYLAMIRKKILIAGRQAREIIALPMVALTLLGCVAYASGWYFDKMMFDIPKNVAVFVEETLELDATLLFFLGACTSTQHENNSAGCYHHST
ncbi:MAG: hypothetical protein V4660_10845 [Pseudomonadota bacterium]